MTGRTISYHLGGAPSTLTEGETLYDDENRARRVRFVGIDEDFGYWLVALDSDNRRSDRTMSAGECMDLIYNRKLSRKRR